MSFLFVLGATAVGVLLMAACIFVPYGVGRLMGSNSHKAWEDGILVLFFGAIGLAFAFVVGSLVLDIAGVDTWIE